MRLPRIDGWVYHGTSKKFLPEIRRHGLVPKKTRHPDEKRCTDEAVVFFSPFQDVAAQWGSVVLTFPWPYPYEVDEYHDSVMAIDDEGKEVVVENSMYTRKSIPREAIRVFEGGKWMPLVRENSEAGERVRALQAKQQEARRLLGELEASIAERAPPERTLEWEQTKFHQERVKRKIAAIRAKMDERDRLLESLTKASNPGKRIFTIKHSKEADRDHAKSARQYAFTRPDAQDDTIYVAMAWFDLPSGFRAGILAHECGHHLAHPDGSEPAADAAFEIATGYPIERRDALAYGKNLEWISAEAQEALYQHFAFK